MIPQDSKKLTEVEREAFRRLPKFLRLALSRSKEYQGLEDEESEDSEEDKDDS